MYPLHITSEIGKLKTVLVHRPGLELENLTPRYLQDLLFDDIPYLEVAKKEHDTFTDILRTNGAEVLYLDQLAAESLDDNVIKQQFIKEMVEASKQGDTRVSESLYSFLDTMNTSDMVHRVMAGIRKNELPLPAEHQQQLHDMVEKDHYPFYLDPMPNLYFTRDPGATIGQGLTINKMHWPARRRESLFLKYIIKYHPRFKDFDIPVWYDRDNKFSMEGGDELILSKDVLAIGISERTTPEAIEALAVKIFPKSSFKRIIAVEIPTKSHAFMHLDTVFTMIDYNKFTIHPEILSEGGHLNMFIMEPKTYSEYPSIRKETDVKKVLAESLGTGDIDLIECGNGDEISAAREQWNDGSNTLAIAPGVVVTYDRNYVTNETLRRHGVNVIEISGAELGRGRGGPRCMSMPLYREDI